jgi:hypothetical protein
MNYKFPSSFPFLIYLFIYFSTQNFHQQRSVLSQYEMRQSFLLLNVLKDFINCISKHYSHQFFIIVFLDKKKLNVLESS